MIGDKKLSKIKEEVLDYALDLWGLDDESKLDPVVALLLDVFAYEAYQLRGELDKSDLASCSVACLVSLLDNVGLFPFLLMA